MAEGERLEPEPMPEFISAGIDRQQKVLVADAELPFPVYPRLI